MARKRTVGFSGTSAFDRNYRAMRAAEMAAHSPGGGPGVDGYTALPQPVHVHFLVKELPTSDRRHFYPCEIFWRNADSESAADDWQEAGELADDEGTAAVAISVNGEVLKRNTRYEGRVIGTFIIQDPAFPGDETKKLEQPVVVADVGDPAAFVRVASATATDGRYDAYVREPSAIGSDTLQDGERIWVKPVGTGTVRTGEFQALFVTRLLEGVGGGRAVYGTVKNLPEDCKSKLPRRADECVVFTLKGQTGLCSSVSLLPSGSVSNGAWDATEAGWVMDASISTPLGVGSAILFRSEGQYRMRVEVGSVTVYGTDLGCDPDDPDATLYEFGDELICPGAIEDSSCDNGRFRIAVKCGGCGVVVDCCPDSSTMPRSFCVTITPADYPDQFRTLLVTFTRGVVTSTVSGSTDNLWVSDWFEPPWAGIDEFVEYPGLGYLGSPRPGVLTGWRVLSACGGIQLQARYEVIPGTPQWHGTLPSGTWHGPAGALDPVTCDPLYAEAEIAPTTPAPATDIYPTGGIDVVMEAGECGPTGSASPALAGSPVVDATSFGVGCTEMPYWWWVDLSPFAGLPGTTGTYTGGAVLLGHVRVSAGTVPKFWFRQTGASGASASLTVTPVGGVDYLYFTCPGTPTGCVYAVAEPFACCGPLTLTLVNSANPLTACASPGSAPASVELHPVGFCGGTDYDAPGPFRSINPNWQPAKAPPPSYSAPTVSTLAEQPKAGIVIGTYRWGPELVALHAAILKETAPGVPVLVSADPPDDDPTYPARLKEACWKADFDLEIGPRLGHSAGDMAAFTRGLRWAQAKGVQYLAKLSYRFVPLVPGWLAEGAAALAESRLALAGRKSEGRQVYPMRTEAVILDVAAWLHRPSVLRDMEAYTFTGTNRPVENFLLDMLKKVDGDGVYLPWTFVTTDRVAPCPRYLWHWGNTTQDYRSLARKHGIVLPPDFTEDGWGWELARGLHKHG